MGVEPKLLRCAVIGAGMAGILSVIKLREAGLNDVTVYEKADRVGGTWRENTYPGLSCDVPSHLYSYSFAPSATWSHRFASGSEIQAYFEKVAQDYDVLEHVRFGDAVTRLEHGRDGWTITTQSGYTDQADVVIAATGVLHHPRYPDINGLESFAGSAFHSARWDHAVELEGARVGIISTGSTAVQIVSAVVDRVTRLSLFQRTAQWVMPQDNPAYTDEQQAEFARSPESLANVRAEQRATFDMFASAVVDADSPTLKLIEQVCRENLEASIRDPVLRERLRPTYRAACKRLIISPDFYEAIQHPNAELVTEHIECVEPAGVRTSDGRLHELDLLVLATGFKVDAFMRPMEIIGRHGVTLEQAWTPRPVAYLSVSIPGFPNFFMLNGPNGPVGNFSLIEVAELQLSYVGELLESVRSGRCHEVCASADALARFEAGREEAAKHTVWVTGCRSWYLDDRGLPAVWPWPFSRFRAAMTEPDTEAYEFT